MSELVWMGNSADSIYMYLVEEYVMRSCRYTTVKCIGDLCDLAVVHACYIFWGFVYCVGLEC